MQKNRHASTKRFRNGTGPQQESAAPAEAAFVVLPPRRGLLGDSQCDHRSKRFGFWGSDFRAEFLKVSAITESLTLLVLDGHRPGIHGLLSSHAFETSKHAPVVVLRALHRESAFGVAGSPRRYNYRKQLLNFTRTVGLNASSVRF